MGKKKTETKQSNEPIYSSQIEGAANTQQAAYNRQAPLLNEFSDNLMGVSNGLLDQFRDGDPTINAARGYIEDTLSSEPQSNPYLNGMIAQTGDNTRRAIQTSLGTRGGIGGSAERDIVSRALAESELGLRYSDYGNQMNRKSQAAGMAPGVSAASYQPLSAAMQAGQTGAMLPLQAAYANSAGVGGLLGQYQNREGEQTQNNGFMDWAGLGLQGASLFSDRRLKTDISRVGQTDSGTPIYTYRYMGDGPFHMGVMADEVPRARGPDVQGFATVNYEKVA